MNWVATQPGITSTIVGATKVTQLDDNLASIDFAIPTDLRKRLDEASALEPAQPYIFFGGEIQSRVAGGVSAELATNTYLRLEGPPGPVDLSCKIGDNQGGRQIAIEPGRWDRKRGAIEALATREARSMKI